MDNQKQLQAYINSRVQNHLPHSASDTTVAIVVANRPAVHLLGTGSLYEIGRYHFVITAAHVIKSAYERGKTIGLSTAHNSFVAVHGEWVIPDPTQFNSFEDPFDIAIHKLPDDAVSRLTGKRFLRREDVDFGLQSSTSVFSLLGFLGIWSEPSRADGEKLSLKALQYTTYAYNGSSELLLKYNPEYHLLLGIDTKDVTQADGSQAKFVTSNNQAATIPRDLKGISGCAVWVVGDLKVPLERWGNQSPKVVAVETGVYQDSQVIQATRWIAVTTLISEVFPELREAIQMWIPE